MLPVLTFASGLIAGIVGVQLLKKAKLPDRAGAAARLDKVQSGLRQAAVSGLTAVETSSAGLRAKLTPAADPAETPVETPAEAAPADPAAVDGEPAPAPSPERGRDA